MEEYTLKTVDSLKVMLQMCIDMEDATVERVNAAKILLEGTPQYHRSRNVVIHEHARSSEIFREAHNQTKNVLWSLWEQGVRDFSGFRYKAKLLDKVEINSAYRAAQNQVV